MNKKIFILLVISTFFIQYKVSAAILLCISKSGNCVEVPPERVPPPNNPGLISRFGCYTGVDCNRTNSMSLMNTELLNLKKDLTVSNGRITSTNSAIQITQSDFENIVQTGKSILFSQGYYDYFYMNIGVPDAINAQTWNLPSNFAEFVDGKTSRLDILLPSAIPPAMRVAGATHVLKEIISEDSGAEADSYMHLQIDGTEVTDLGTSYDFDSGNDDNFDEEPDVELYDVPLDLGDSQVTEDFPIDEETNDNYLKINTATTVDAFGIINTPYGSFECLRQTEITKYFRRTDSTASFGTTPNYEFRRVKWITKNGFTFSAAVQSEDVNHVGLLGFVELTRFVPTNTLTSASAVKINNDSHGISINNTDFVADSSAILDIRSENKGVLIPRVTQANRPANPADGLIIYQIDGTKGLYVYISGLGWKRLATE